MSKGPDIDRVSLYDKLIDILAGANVDDEHIYQLTDFITENFEPKEGSDGLHTEAVESNQALL